MGLGGIVKGKRTTLRAPTEDDLGAIARWMADMRVRHLARVWHEPAMPATWKERLTDMTKEKERVLWSIEAGGVLVGMTIAGFGWEPHRDGARVQQFVIDPQHWRHGYGMDAAVALHRFFFDYSDLRRALVTISADNAGALRIAERLGYVTYGHKHEVHYRDGGYVDELELLLDRATWDERFANEREYEPLGATTTPKSGG